MRPRWQHVLMIGLLWCSVSLATRGDSCDKQEPSKVVATPDPKTPLDQLEGVVVIITVVTEANVPIPNVKVQLDWESDNTQVAGTTSSGITDATGQVTFAGFPDVDYGTWNVTVDGNYTQSVSRFRKSGNPNRYTYVAKIIPSPSPTPTPTPTPTDTPTPSPSISASPTASPTVSPTPTAAPTTNPVDVSVGGGGGAPATPVPGSTAVSTKVIITEGSPQAANPIANMP